MTSVSEFTPYYLRYLWREGDTALAQDLPRLIREAEARISRDLRDNNLIATEEILLVPPADTIPLPPDYRELVKLSFVSERVARAVSPDTMDTLRRQRRPYDDTALLYYSIYGGNLHVATWDVSLIGMEMTYHMGIRPFSVVDGEPSFYDRHPDFFLAALNVQTYSYMRDFDLSNEFNSKYATLLEDMRRESNYAIYPSGQLTTPLSSIVK